jgi:hypothetical protein
LSQVLGEYQQVVSERIEMVNNGLAAVAADFVEPVRRSIGRLAGGLYEQQATASGPHFVFHLRQQGASDTTTLSHRIHNDPT